ncbi:MAG: glycosyltransferase family 4 protein [Acidobacteria bacterium]|nr:glycosyltransferase family 4 protein [Acidobacteriota bacterium]
MKIAQVAPLYESVPPKLYGGTERVVSYLTEELVKQGHDVTLYASGDSQTSARLRSVCEKSLRLEGGKLLSPLAHHLNLIETVAQEADEYDLVHFHLDYLPFSQIRRLEIPAVTTLHGRLDIPDLYPLFREFDDMRLISISDAQRAPMPWASWLATVYHGLPADLHEPSFERGEYLAFLGRISPEKRVDRAIEIAKLAGMQLRVAAKIDDADRNYFESEISDLLVNSDVEFVGEIGEKDKTSFLGKAAALLFPIDWPEPFGLVMIEAMSCGTPVIAFRGGSVAEIIDDGITGFIVESVEEAVEAWKKIPSLDRKSVHQRFLERFTSQKMGEKYIEAYELGISEKTRAARGKRGLSLAI